MRINPRNPSFDDSRSEAFFQDWSPDFSGDSEREEPLGDSLDGLIERKDGSSLCDDTVARVMKEDVSRFAGSTCASRTRYEPPPVDETIDVIDGDRDQTAVREPVSRKTIFPDIGEAIGGFRLISELGRGAFARVYLAQELGLGSRHVALKVSKAEGEEPQILARLQHTNIVPIHSLLDDPQTGLRLMCMPYFGGANLAQVLEAAGAHRGGQTQGRSLINALDLIGQPVIATRGARTQVARGVSLAAAALPPPAEMMSTPATLAATQHTMQRSLLERIPWWRQSLANAPVEEPSTDSTETLAQPARQFMNAATYVRASVWLMARLAEGLEHAHSRQLLHRDLKPSNILIAADGTPMLLDFNLATESEVDAAESGEKARIGGTLPYMAPEHLDAFNPNGKTSAADVGVQADIYALGLILFEMIAGRHPFPSPPDQLKLIEAVELMHAQRSGPAPSLRYANPEVPWSLDAIVTKCIDPNPAKRYRTAGQFAEELRRFLDDQPLKYTKEPSIRESVKKWAKRHPKASSASTILPIVGCLIFLIFSAMAVQSRYLKTVAARLNLRKFHDDFQECQFLLNTTSGGDLTGHLTLGVKKAQAAIERYGITKAGDWDKSYWAAPLSGEERKSLKQDIAELIVLEARAKVAIAEREGTEDDRRRVLEWAVSWLDLAERFVPTPSAAVYADRGRYNRALGNADLARRDLALAEKTPSDTCRDEYLMGTSDLAVGRYDRAEQRLNHAVSLDSQRFWAWFALGICHYDQGRFEQASHDFSVCTVIMKDFAWPFANRGQALARAGRLAEARDAYSKALDLSPNFVDALVGRGLVSLELGLAVDAEADLRKARTLSPIDASAEAGLAEALAKQGKQGEAVTILSSLIAAHPGDARLLAARGMIQLTNDAKSASDDFQAAIKLDPAAPMAYYGQARLLYRTDLSKALFAVDQALERSPSFLDATQLRALIRARLGRGDAVNDVKTLLQNPTDNRLYNAACAMAALAQKQPSPAHQTEALNLLRRAIDAGFPREIAKADPDFALFANNEKFHQIVDTKL